MIRSEISEEHFAVINSLRNMFEGPKVDQPKFSGTISHRTSGTYADHMELMKNYVCSCGCVMKEADLMSYKKEGKIVNEHFMVCGNCAANEKVSFSMLRSTFKVNPFQKKSKEFPYI